MSIPLSAGHMHPAALLLLAAANSQADMDAEDSVGKGELRCVKFGSATDDYINLSVTRVTPENFYMASIERIVYTGTTPSLYSHLQASNHGRLRRYIGRGFILSVDLGQTISCGRRSGLEGPCYPSALRAGSLGGQIFKMVCSRH